jgi:hypothetical protein
MSIGEPVGYIVNKTPLLEFASCFISTPYGDQPDGRPGRAKQGIYTKEDVDIGCITLLSATMRLR